MDTTLERQLARHLAGLRAAGVEFVQMAGPPPAGFFSTSAEPAAPAEDDARIPLATLAASYDACTRCTAIASTRVGTVPGHGPVGARLFVLGDAPRKQDVDEKRPFTGQAGETLTKMLTAIGIDRAEAYLSTALRCRPPGDRRPSAKEHANCRPYLERELQAVGPKFVLCLGEVAGQSLLQTDEPLAAIRAKVHDLRGLQVVCTHHPDAFDSNPRLKKEAWADLQLLMKSMRSQN